MKVPENFLENNGMLCTPPMHSDLPQENRPNFTQYEETFRKKRIKKSTAFSIEYLPIHP